MHTQALGLTSYSLSQLNARTFYAFYVDFFYFKMYSPINVTSLWSFAAVMQYPMDKLYLLIKHISWTLFYIVPPNSTSIH